MKKSYYDCKICLDESNEPIVTLCGHIYCWDCIYKWSSTKQKEIIPCPFCQNSVNIKKVIPIYTSKDNHKKNKTDKIPKRPKPEENRYRENLRRNNFNMNFNFFGFRFFQNFGNRRNGENNGNRRNGGNQNLNRNRNVSCFFIPFFFLPFFANIIYWILDIFLYPTEFFFPENDIKKKVAYSKFSNLVKKSEYELILEEEDFLEDIMVLITIFVIFFILLMVIVHKVKSLRRRARNIEENLNNRN